MREPVTAPPQYGETAGRETHLCFTDGLVEEHWTAGEAFGEDQLITTVNQSERTGHGVRAVTRSLSHTLKRAGGGHTTDDATLLMVEWRG